MAVTFRAFSPDDLPRLHEIRRAAFAEIYASFRQLVGPEIAPSALADAEDGQGAHLDEVCAGAGLVVVAALDGVIVGFAAYALNGETRHAELGLNAVHPDHRDKGIGAALYEHVLERMRQAGMITVEVSTGGDPSHAAARRAYEKAGFGPAIPSVTLYRRL